MSSKCPNCGAELVEGIHICYPKNPIIITSAEESRRIAKMQLDADKPLGYAILVLGFLVFVVLILWTISLVI